MKKKKLSELQVTGIVICSLFEVILLVCLVGMIVTADSQPFLPMGAVVLLFMVLVGVFIFAIVRDRMLPETVQSLYGRLLGGAFTASGQRSQHRKLINAARLYAQENNRKSLEQLLELEPDCIADDDFAAVYAFMALNHSRLGDHREAVSFYLNSLAYIPGQPRLLSNLSACLTRLGRYDEAITYGMKAIELNDMDAFALSNTAYALMRAGREREAIELAERSLELNELQAQPIKVLCLAWYRLGDMQKSSCYYNLGRAKGFPAQYLDPTS